MSVCKERTGEKRRIKREYKNIWKVGFVFHEKQNAPYRGKNNIPPIVVYSLRPLL
jgi:hypothetical protein